MIYRILSRMVSPAEIRKFFDGEEALKYFQQATETPSLVICDINMPRMNGIELKQNIEADAKLAARHVPFVFLSTTANPDQIAKAFSLSCQGFFIKGQSFAALKETVSTIAAYWRLTEYAIDQRGN